MMLLPYRRLLCASLLLSLLAGVDACRPLAINASLENGDDEQTATSRRQRHDHAQKKWDEFAQALKIHNNHMELSAEESAAIDRQYPTTAERLKAKDRLMVAKYAKVLSRPSDYLVDPKAQGDYKKLVYRIADRFSSQAYATRCAAVVGFRAVDAVKPNTKVDVYELSYKLQANRAGDAEAIVRRGLITIPQAASGAGETDKKTFPLLGYAHADDQGLSYVSMERNLPNLQEHHIVVAPSFPGEPICAGESGDRDPETGEPNLSCARPEDLLAPAVGQGVPWGSDADELLGMYDCVAKVAAGHFVGARPEGENLELLNPLYLNQPADGASDEATLALSSALEGRVRFVELVDGNYAFPMGSLVGASRGGLVVSIALAKAGAAWRHILLAARQQTKQDQEARKAWSAEERKAHEGEPAFAEGLLNYYMSAVSMGEILAETPAAGMGAEYDFTVRLFGFIADKLGARYGALPPPGFNGALTLAAPTSITVGRLRLQLEQMVKGNGDATYGMFLPGLRQLSAAFDRYRADEVGVDEAIFEVVGRDATFLAPLMFGSLKRWNKGASIVSSVRVPKPPRPKAGSAAEDDEEYLAQLEVAEAAQRGLQIFLERGSLLMFHHEDDKIVPFEQMQVAANVFLAQANNSEIRALIMSPSGVELTIRPLVKSESNMLAGAYRFDHIDEAFYKQSYCKLRPTFFAPKILELSFAKDHFFDFPFPIAAQLVDQAIKTELDQQLSAGTQQLAGAGSPGFNPSLSFETQDLAGVFATYAQGSALSLEQMQTFSLLQLHAANGSLPSALLQQQTDGSFVSPQTPAETIAAWRDTLY